MAIGDVRVSGAAGRNWSGADSASMVDFGDCARVNLAWKDGASLYFLVDDAADAAAWLAAHGFAPAAADFGGEVEDFGVVAA